MEDKNPLPMFDSLPESFQMMITIISDETGNEYGVWENRSDKLLNELDLHLNNNGVSASLFFNYDSNYTFFRFGIYSYDPLKETEGMFELTNFHKPDSDQELIDHVIQMIKILYRVKYQ